MGLSVASELSTRIDIRLLQVGFDGDVPPSRQLSRVAELVAEQQGADLVVLPEMWLHGAFVADRWPTHAIELAGPELRLLSESASSIGAYVLAGSFAETARAPRRSTSSGPTLWNTSVLFDREGSQIAHYRKIHRFGFDDGERAIIEAGRELVTAALTDREGRHLCTMGMATCYDLRFPEMFRMLVDQGAELFVIPAAWPLSRVLHWRALGIARAIENQAFVVQVNDGGHHGGLDMGGSSQVVDPNGNVLASLGLGECVSRVQLDMGHVGISRHQFPVLRDRELVCALPAWSEAK